jgi:YHS domain-containing protein
VNGEHGRGQGASGQSYDPICGVRVENGGARPSSEYKKRRYYFCSHRCKAEFDKAAERIRMQEVARAGALFTQGKVRWALA